MSTDPSRMLTSSPSKSKLRPRARPRPLSLPPPPFRPRPVDSHLMRPSFSHDAPPAAAARVRTRLLLLYSAAATFAACAAVACLAPSSSSFSSVEGGGGAYLPPPPRSGRRTRGSPPPPPPRSEGTTTMAAAKTMTADDGASASPAAGRRRYPPRTVGLLYPDESSDPFPAPNVTHQLDWRAPEAVNVTDPTDNAGRKVWKDRNPPTTPPLDQSGCIPAHGRRASARSTCNLVHEIDLVPLGGGGGGGGGRENVRILGRGSWRAAWTWGEARSQSQSPSRPDSVLKSALWILGYDELTLRRHAVDAVVSDGMSSSPYAVRAFGYCGQASINEYMAEGSELGELVEGSLVRDVEALDDDDGGDKGEEGPRADAIVNETGRSERGGRGDRRDLRFRLVEKPGLPSRERLRLAYEVARGIADLHGASAVYKDLKEDNVVIGGDGRARLGDFNDAELVMWNTTTTGAGGGEDDGGGGNPCRFRRKIWETRFHSPEEALGLPLTSAVDVYALGGIIYLLLTGREPYAVWPGRLSSSEYPRAIRKGRLPELPGWVLSEESGSDPNVRVMAEVMGECWRYDPGERPTAGEAAGRLWRALLASSGEENATAAPAATTTTTMTARGGDSPPSPEEPKPPPPPPALVLPNRSAHHATPESKNASNASSASALLVASGIDALSRVGAYVTTLSAVLPEHSSRLPVFLERWGGIPLGSLDVNNAMLQGGDERRGLGCTASLLNAVTDALRRRGGGGGGEGGGNATSASARASAAETSTAATYEYYLFLEDDGVPFEGVRPSEFASRFGEVVSSWPPESPYLLLGGSKVCPAGNVSGYFDGEGAGGGGRSEDGGGNRTSSRHRRTRRRRRGRQGAVRVHMSLGSYAILVRSSFLPAFRALLLRHINERGHRLYSPDAFLFREGYFDDSRPAYIAAPLLIDHIPSYSTSFGEKREDRYMGNERWWETLPLEKNLCGRGSYQREECDLACGRRKRASPS